MSNRLGLLRTVEVHNLTIVVRPAMDEEAAVAEARRRWGERGAVSIADQWRKARCLVGELCEGPRFRVRGRGSTWEAAFLDADARLLHASRRCSDRQRGRGA
jgi:hypothetical protein